MVSPMMPISLGLTSGFSLSDETRLLKYPFIIGICGGSCSGKSQITERLKKSLDFSACVINEFDFYKPLRGKEKKSEEEKLGEPDYSHNFDKPEEIDWELLLHCLESINMHKPFDCPQYDLIKQKRLKKTVKIFPTPVVIVEGVYTLGKPQVREMLDLKIFVDCPDDVRLGNRVRKFSNLYKHSLEFIIDYYMQYTKPAFETYVEPSKFYADLIIPNNGTHYNNKGVDMMINHIVSTIYGREKPNSDMWNRLRYDPIKIRMEKNSTEYSLEL